MADTGDEKQQKMEVDYSSTVDEKLPKCEKLAKVHNETYAWYDLSQMWCLSW